jgi:hypothetical protein
MGRIDYKRYRIALGDDSSKVQGLRVGDIIRRQYQEGSGNTIYSLMCVLDATDKYFDGALLDGVKPQQGELLDFARITSLTDEHRSGAMYLTASDDEAPYMDVIDGIGINSSLAFPEMLVRFDAEDTSGKYAIEEAEAEYIDSDDEASRICHIVGSNAGKLHIKLSDSISLSDRLVVAYKVKSSSHVTLNGVLGYSDGTRTDGEATIEASLVWKYKVHIFSLENSDRYERTFSVDLSELAEGEEFYIADFNIIPLSELTGFGAASQLRIGKLTGISDSVFGDLDGYGGFMQKLFASKAAHISGTLTAGDENGFASTFYAGKIHKNSFINSISPRLVGDVEEEGTSPTGVGLAYKCSQTVSFTAQSEEWLQEYIGQAHVFSFWAKFNSSCIVDIFQNNRLIHSLIVSSKANAWHRYTVKFRLLEAEGECLQFAISPDRGTWHFSAPQLEKGTSVTQYQPTDDSLDYSGDYGAWFNRGGIGGTIQNPLLRLGEDGSVQSRNNSFKINYDGSGHVANGGIAWDNGNNLTFGSNIILGWENLSSDVRNEMVSKSLKIVGLDTFTLLGDRTTDDKLWSPQAIDLVANVIGFDASDSPIKWEYLDEYTETYQPLAEGVESITVYPDDPQWHPDSNMLTIKMSITSLDKTYSDIITIKKLFISSYEVRITSEKGDTFKNGVCQTVLKAHVYYLGELVDTETVQSTFTFRWKKYRMPDFENELEDWWGEQDRTSDTLIIDTTISGSDVYQCELRTKLGFAYEFPIVFS